MAAKIKSIGKSGSGDNTKPKGISARQFEKVHWPYLPLLVVIFFLFSVVVQNGALMAAVRNGNGSVLSYATSMSVSGLLSSTNSARSANGVKSLSLNSKLNNAAFAKANDMASRDYWDHYTPEGNPPWVFVTAQGYSYLKLGENLATGFNDEQSTINGWMASPPHRANLLDSEFTEVGFGYANISDYTAAGGGPQTIVVAFYGKPASSGSAPAPAPPSVAATPPSAPPAASTKETGKSTKKKSAKPTEKPEPKKETEETPQAESTTKDSTKLPANTDNLNTGITLSFRSTRADITFAKMPMYNFATGIAIFGVLASIGLWFSRHALAFRRTLRLSEAFIVRHPMIDVGLLIIAGLSYLLTQTAGFIQ